MITQEIINLYDAFTHGHIPRREFLSQLATLAGSMTAAATLLPLLENDYGRMPPAHEAYPDISDDYISYPGASGQVHAYHAKPEFEGPYPAVVVIHENRGLNPYIEDVARRLADVGFWALAPDALSCVGGTPEDQDLAREKIGELNKETAVQDFVAAVNFASSHTETNGKVGCVGFCWGGGIANQLAVHCENLIAAVSFYGSQPKSEDVPAIKAAMMLHYAGLDERINDGIPAYEEALKEAGTEYVKYMYDNVNHAFHNHTNAARYNADAADLAWKRTIAFFNTHLN